MPLELVVEPPHDAHELDELAQVERDALEPQLGEHLALGRRDVIGRQPVRRVHQHVAAAGVAAAEPGQLEAQFLVLPLRHFPGHVRYPTTASSCPSGTALKVEPVVPVRRTWR